MLAVINRFLSYFLYDTILSYLLYDTILSYLLYDTIVHITKPRGDIAWSINWGPDYMDAFSPHVHTETMKTIIAGFTLGFLT